MKDRKMLVRQAVVADVDAIMKVEKESFGEVGADTMASRAQMEQRIKICNGYPNDVGWFLVAESDGVVCAYLSLQPTDLLPENCVSWESATDNGTFRTTFDIDGETIFGASLATGKGAPPGATDLLIHRTITLWWQTGKKRIMFCSRLPGLQEACRKGNMTPEQYWCATDRRKAPRDPLLKVFHHYFGVGPYKFLPNGFVPDVESCGHAALVVVGDPFFALRKLPELIYAEGMQHAQAKKGERE